MSELTADTAPIHGSIVKPKLGRDDIVMRTCMVVIGIFLIYAILLPLYTML